MTSDALTNTTLPSTEATITVRVIKSFEHRTTRSLVLHKLNLQTTTVGELKDKTKQVIRSNVSWRPYQDVAPDTLKVYTKAHGAKTSNLIINLDHEDWFLENDNCTLADAGCENETEVSFFEREDYDKYKHNPVNIW